MFIIGCYVAPDNASIIESVIAALIECPRGSELLVPEDCNANLNQPEGDHRKEEIAAELMVVGL